MNDSFESQSLESTAKEEQSRFLLESECNSSDTSTLKLKNYNALGWKIATVLLAIFSGALCFVIAVMDQRSISSKILSMAHTQDFVSAREVIRYENVSFIGAPVFQENGKLVVPHQDPKFVGEPRQELDEAWANLTVSTYIRISEREAKETWGERYDMYWNDARSGYIAGLEMFHTLHCLNRLRMSLFPEYYQFKGYEQFNDENHAVHRDHCIQQIRQYIMCHGDMTPLPTRYSTVTDTNYVFSDELHTCRNFDALKEWSDARHHGETEIPPYERISGRALV